MKGATHWRLCVWLKYVWEWPVCWLLFWKSNKNSWAIIIMLISVLINGLYKLGWWEYEVIPWRYGGGLQYHLCSSWGSVIWEKVKDPCCWQLHPITNVGGEWAVYCLFLRNVNKKSAIITKTALLLFQAIFITFWIMHQKWTRGCEINISVALPIKILNPNTHTHTPTSKWNNSIQITFTKPEQWIGHLRHTLHVGHVNEPLNKTKEPYCISSKLWFTVATLRQKQLIKNKRAI